MHSRIYPALLRCGYPSNWVKKLDIWLSRRRTFFQAEMNKTYGKENRSKIMDDKIARPEIHPNAADRLTKVRFAKYDNRFPSLVSRFLLSKNVNDQLSALEKLQPLLAPDCVDFPCFRFHPDSPKFSKASTARRKDEDSKVNQVYTGLLDTLAKLLDNVDVIMLYAHKESYIESIYRILTRYEFDLIHYPEFSSFSFNNVIEDGDLSFKEKEFRSNLHHLKRYKKFLCRAINYSISKLRGEHMVFSYKKFCLKLLVIGYFRIPVLSGVILETLFPLSEDTCSKKASDFKNGSSNEKSTCPETDREIITDTYLFLYEEISSESKNIFFDWNPSLFSWTKVIFSDNDNAVVENVTRNQQYFHENSGDTMFSFISFLVSFMIEHTHGGILWSSVPGFLNMAEISLSKIKVRKKTIENYSN